MIFPFLTQIQLDKTLAKAEEALNLVGYIPLVSLLSATLRSLGGMLQTLLSLIFAAVNFVAGFISKKPRHFRNFRLSVHYIFHGIFNIIRAKIEAVPCLSLITCLPYDRLLKKRFKYPSENHSDDEMEIEVEGL